MNVASKFVMKLSAIGGINLAQCSRVKTVKNGCTQFQIIQIDEVFVKINCETHYLWRAVNHEGEVLETFVSKQRDRKAALVFLKNIMKRHGQPRAIVTDRLRSYRAAMKMIGNTNLQNTGRWVNNRAENSHLPFRRREYAMLKFRRMRSLQKFVSIHSSVQNHFNQERPLIDREKFKLQRNAALAEWQQLCAA